MFWSNQANWSQNSCFGSSKVCGKKLILTCDWGKTFKSFSYFHIIYWNNYFGMAVSDHLLLWHFRPFTLGWPFQTIYFCDISDHLLWDGRSRPFTFVTFQTIYFGMAFPDHLLLWHSRPFTFVTMIFVVFLMDYFNNRENFDRKFSLVCWVFNNIICLHVYM